MDGINGINGMDGIKTVISFDVGMKNLAYCLFQIGFTNSGENHPEHHTASSYKILQWEVINLCTPIVKKCNNCPEIAKYCKTICDHHSEYGNDTHDDTHENENGNENNVIIEYYCTKHAKKSNLKIPPSDLDMKKLKKKKLVEIQSIIDKYNITPILSKSHDAHTPLVKKSDDIVGSTVTIDAPPTNKRQKNTKEQMLDMIQQELNIKYVEHIENVRADEIDLLTLGKNMMMELDKFIEPYPSCPVTRDVRDARDLGKMGGLGCTEKHKIDIVIIENQISTIASRMKTLQGMIAQYFIMRGTPCIEFISAANKLKMFMTKKKTTYTERKIESVEVTKDLLERLPQFEKYKGYLEKNKKKDDLADCFLQGIYYLTLKKYINIDL